MDENHIDAETEAKLKILSEADRVAEDWIRDAEEARIKEAAKLAEMDRAREEHVQRVTKEFAETRPVIQDPTAPDSMFVAETPLVYQKEFFGFLLTVTKNSVGILIELHTSVKASAVFGLCCRFLTGLGVPAAQIGGVEPIFSEWLPFPDAEL